MFQKLLLSSQTLVKFTFFLFAASYAFVNETVAIVLPVNVKLVVFGVVCSAASPTLTFVSVVVVS